MKIFCLILHLVYLTVTLKEKTKRDTKQKMILLCYVVTVLSSKSELFHFTLEEEMVCCVWSTVLMSSTNLSVTADINPHEAMSQVIMILCV